MPPFKQCVQFQSFKLLSARKFDCEDIEGIYNNILPVRIRSPLLDVLPKALRNLYDNMSRTTESVVPLAFLTVLRQVAPQFAEIGRSKSGGMGGYAQQGLFLPYSYFLDVTTNTLLRCGRVLDTDPACTEGRSWY